MKLSKFDGKKLKAERISKGMSIFDLAVELYQVGNETSTVQIRNWEDKSVPPGLDKYIALCDVLKRPYSFFLTKN